MPYDNRLIRPMLVVDAEGQEGDIHLEFHHLYPLRNLRQPPEGAPGAPIRAHVSMRMLAVSLILGVNSQLNIDRRHLVLWMLLDVISLVLIFIALDAMIAFILQSFGFPRSKVIFRTNQSTIPHVIDTMKRFYSVF